MLDIDGFFISKKMSYREIGYARMDGTTGHTMVRSGCRFHDLSDKDKRMVVYTTNVLTGLSFEATAEESAIEQNEVEQYVKDAND